MEKTATPHILEQTPPYLDQDGLWKEVITELFEPFVLFFAPELYKKIDWSKQPDSLEQEFRRLFPVRKGKRYTDKLMKVYLKSGEEHWILIHIEVQGYKDEDFAERMFQYFYRIFDKYQKKIYAIALFADEDRSFKPAAYTYQFHGTELNYTYNTYKILDQDEEELLQSDNPFAYAVLAGLYMLNSRNNASKRYQFKRRLFEVLIRDKKVQNRDYADSLLFFIDYLLKVPIEMKEALQEEIKPMVEEVNHMDRTKYPDPPTLKPIYDKIREEERKEIALVLLRKGFADEDIIEATGLTEEKLNDLKAGL